MAPNPYSPGTLSLLPLLYVAWADRSLNTAEVRLLKKKAASLPFLTADDRRLLGGWSNPYEAPSRELMQQWGIVLHDAAATLDREGRESLAELGVSMARAALAHRAQPVLAEAGTVVAGDYDALESDGALAAIRELEEIIGDVDRRTLAAILPTDEAEGSELRGYTFDVSAMTALLDGRYASTYEHMRHTLAQPEFAYRPMPVKEDFRAQTLAWTKSLAAEGLGALALPEAYGGEDDMGRYAAVFDSLGYHEGSLAIKFGVQFGLFAGSIANLGTRLHFDKYLADAGSLALPGCFAMTETGHGSNVRGLETTATYDGDTGEFAVHTPHWGAGKEYIGNALDARMASVFCQLIVGGENRGVHAVLVPVRDLGGELLPGITCEDSGYKMGLNGVDNGRFWFDQVRVPRENLLNRFGDVSAEGVYSSPIENPGKRFFTMLGTLVGGRVCVPRAGLSATKAGLAIAVNYALRRRQFAPAPTLPETLLLDYPSHQRRLMPLLAKTYALHFGLDRLLEDYVNRTPDGMRELESRAAGMKAYATWFTTAALQECREACGGKGYLWSNRIGRLKDDTEIYTTFEGDNTVLCYLVARSLLTKFREEFGAEGIFGVLRIVTGRITSQFTDLNPIAVRNTDAEHLRDPNFQLAALRFREERMLYSLAQRLRRKIKGGTPSAEAFVHVQTHLRDLALAYIERLVYERFRENVSRLADTELRTALERLLGLYGLHAIEAHAGWFFEYDFLSSAKSKAIRREVDKLCGEVRQDAAGLVDAFAIPNSVLGASVLS